jgi:excisionase family DNA binding protein
VAETHGAPESEADTRPWQPQIRAHERALSEALDFAALTPDIAFVAFLRTFSRFGFFTFGPITIDVALVEDLLMRTHPRGDGGPDHAPPATPESLELGNLGWQLLTESGSPVANERDVLRTFLRWGKGLPARVFGELGVTAEEIDRYIDDLSAGRLTPQHSRGRLLSPDEAAEYLGVHSQTIRSWIRSGKLPAARLAGLKSIRIREADLENVLERIEPSNLDS